MGQRPVLGASADATMTGQSDPQARHASFGMSYSSPPAAPTEGLSDSELRAQRREQRAAEKDERLAQASASGGRMRQ